MLLFCSIVGERDERAAPHNRHAPIIVALVVIVCAAISVVVVVAPTRLAGEVFARIEHVEGRKPVRRGRSGLAGQCERGILGDDVTEEE